MQHFYYEKQHLYAEKVPLTEVAKQFGTPAYVYSEATLNDQWQMFVKAFADCQYEICYAVKANSSLAILQFFANKKAGFDIVSLGELERVLAAGGNPKRIVFSGVGKTSQEIARALEVGIACFNVESTAELDRIHAIAKERHLVAPIALRVNPDVDAKTHPHIATGSSINKFGIEFAEIVPLSQKIQKMPHIKLIGLACHIGSQLMELSPFIAASQRMVQLLQALKSLGISLSYLNLGGGLGVSYRDEKSPPIDDYAKILRDISHHHNVTVITEPGRSLVAHAGVLLTRVEYIKTAYHKNFAIIDAGMNDLMRPTLYDAWHDIIPVELHEGKKESYDIVGPLCESSDVLGKSREMVLKPQDLLAIKTVGAYGFSMCSNYNSRPKPCEIMIQDQKIHLIRERESVQGLYAGEKLILY